MVEVFIISVYAIKELYRPQIPRWLKTTLRFIFGMEDSGWEQAVCPTGVWQWQQRCCHSDLLTEAGLYSHKPPLLVGPCLQLMKRKHNLKPHRFIRAALLPLQWERNPSHWIMSKFSKLPHWCYLRTFHPVLCSPWWQPSEQWFPCQRWAAAAGGERTSTGPPNHIWQSKEEKI